MRTRATLVGILLSIVLISARATLAAPIVDPIFSGSYTLTDLGPVPGLPAPYGGLTTALGDTSTLVIGGLANHLGGGLFTIGLVRDGSGHITGYSGAATPFGPVGEYNDGGVVYGPGGVLFAAQWPVNNLGQTAPGSTDEDRVDDLAPLGVGGGGPGGLTFVPATHPGAGQFKLVTWSAGDWYTLGLAPDGSGTFDIVSTTLETTLGGGPEGIAYIPIGSPLFPNPSVVVSEWSANTVGVYDVDANGDPVVATRRTFLSGLTGAEGAFIDPVTGDFLFSTFGAGTDRVFRVSGFVPPPPPPVPEPTTLLLFGTGLAAVGLRRYRRKP